AESVPSPVLGRRSRDQRARALLVGTAVVAHAGGADLDRSQRLVAEAAPDQAAQQVAVACGWLHLNGASSIYTHGTSPTSARCTSSANLGLPPAGQPWHLMSPAVQAAGRTAVAVPAVRATRPLLCLVYRYGSLRQLQVLIDVVKVDWIVIERVA